MQIDQAYASLSLVQDFVPVGNSNRPGKKLVASSITIHNTDNSSPGANAAAHARYMKGADAQSRQVSWHFTVDDTFVYQSIPTNEVAWHARKANASSIGIEICQNPELDVAKTYWRAALLTALLSYRLGIQVPTGIFQHFDWTGKNCPGVLRSTANGWSKFLDQVTANHKALKPVPTIEIALSQDQRDHHAA